MTLASDSPAASDNPTVSDELRDRAGAFVNSHVDLWVTVEEEGTLILAGANPADLLQAAADWLREGPDYAVAEIGWERRPAEPAYTLRMGLRRPESGTPQ